MVILLTNQNIPYLFHPSIKVILVPRKSIDQEIGFSRLLKMRLKLYDQHICFVHLISKCKGWICESDLDINVTFIALTSREQVIATGTIVPLVIWCSMSSPYSEPGAFLSARKRSPETQEKVYESENELVKRLNIYFCIMEVILTLQYIPADKWTYPYSSTIFWHWVPFPEPGAPKTNTTFGFSSGLVAVGDIINIWGLLFVKTRQS